MKVNDLPRLVAGILVLISVLLSYYVDERWLLLSVFVSFNLIQSAFTNRCPMNSLMNK